VPENVVLALKDEPVMAVPVGAPDDVTVGAVVTGAGVGAGAGAGAGTGAGAGGGVGANGFSFGVGAGAGGGVGAGAAELSACVVIDPLVFELAEVPMAFVALTVKV